MQVRQVPKPLPDVEPITDEQLIRDGEADVPDRQILDEAAIGAVEQRDDGQRRRLPQAERLGEVVQREAGVDDVLDDQDVAVRDLRVEILEQADPRVAAGVRVGAVAGQLEEVDRVRDRDRTREVGDEDEARLERGDEQRLAIGVVARDLTAELADARRELLSRQVDLADVVRL
jgi:hypothetical protein